MPTLLPELSRAMAESGRRAAESAAEDVRQAERLRDRANTLPATPADRDALRQHLTREARAAVRDVLAAAEANRDHWEAAIPRLRAGLTVEEQVALLRGFAEAADAARRRLALVRQLWAVVEGFGDAPDAADDLATADRVFDRIRAEARRAIEARTTPWRPADPARLEQGRQQIRDGLGVGSAEARMWFRKAAK